MDQPEQIDANQEFEDAACWKCGSVLHQTLMCLSKGHAPEVKSELRRVHRNVVGISPLLRARKRNTFRQKLELESGPFIFEVQFFLTSLTGNCIVNNSSA